MRDLALLLSRLVMVTGGFCLCFVLFASLVAPPVRAPQAMHPAIDDTPVWTEHPVRIDGAHRVVEPLRDPFPYRFRAPANMQTHDGGSFTAPDGGIMVLENIVAPQPRALCTAANGRRSACGARARAELRTLLAGKYVECRRSLLVAGVWLADCHVNGRNIAQTMLDRADITGVRRAGPQL